LPVLQVQVINPGSMPATLTGLTLNAIGTGDDLSGVESVEVWLDTDGDGTVGSGDTLLGVSVYNGNNGTATFILDTLVSGGDVVTLLVVDNFSSTAPDGTYQTNINVGGLSGTFAGGAVPFTGLPVSSAIITMAHPTETPTGTPMATFTPTPTRTHTRTTTATATSTRSHTPTASTTATPSPSFTATPSASPTFTITETPSVTMTATTALSATPTPSGNTNPIIYPNPSDGRPVNILPPLTKVSDVKVQIFTLGFRKVNEASFPQVLPGVSVSINLVDRWNKPLSNGLYYIVVTTDEGRSIAKLMIIR
jgi:hypothetical protein